MDVSAYSVLSIRIDFTSFFHQTSQIAMEASWSLARIFLNWLVCFADATSSQATDEERSLRRSCSDPGACKSGSDDDSEPWSPLSLQSHEYAIVNDSNDDEDDDDEDDDDDDNEDDEYDDDDDEDRDVDVDGDGDGDFLFFDRFLARNPSGREGGRRTGPVINNSSSRARSTLWTTPGADRVVQVFQGEPLMRLIVDAKFISCKTYLFLLWMLDR